MTLAEAWARFGDAYLIGAFFFAIAGVVAIWLMRGGDMADVVVLAIGTVVVVALWPVCLATAILLLPFYLF